MHLTHRCPALLLAMALLAACQPADDPSGREDPAVEGVEAEHLVSLSAGETWDLFVTEFIEAHLAAHPAWAVMQGRHEYDGQLPDWSAAGLQAEIDRLKAARATALAFDAAELGPEKTYQREYLVARVEHDLFWLEKARWPYRNPQFYFGWLSDSLDPAPYITLDYAPLAQRMAAFTDYLEALPRATRQIRDNLEMPMPLTWLQLGVNAFGGYADYFSDEVPAIWAGVEDAELQGRFETANAAAVAAMRELVEWLESNRASATGDFALGPELFRQMLWDTERVNVPLDELEAIGRADMERNLGALRQACEEFAPGAPIRDCFSRMADRKPEGGPVEAAREQLTETRAFVEQQDLASIPGTEAALVRESPPYARSNFAYINIPGPWEENQPSVYYITPPDPTWPPEVQAGYIPGEADLLFTSVHEVWPGHFLNFLHANRAEWLFGRAFVGYAFGEGWAHYTEEMMLEAGLRGADPETRIGQLSNALLRNARFLSAIGLHTGGWSVEDAQRFFIEEGFQDEGTARQQAARGTYDPAYLNYTMGKLLILRLREDWTADRGGRAAWREFHDRFLSFGGPPIPLVRQQMLGEDAPRAVFPGQVDSAATQAEPALTRSTWAWNCEDGRTVVSRTEDQGLWLVLPGESLRLQREQSASGARYEGGGVVFWNQGEEATLWEGATTTTCRVDRQASVWEDARMRGIDFRAVGNEPGWVLEMIIGGPSRLVTDYGAQEHEFMLDEPDPDAAGEAAVFHARGDEPDVVVTLWPGPCLDTMIEQEYENRVEILLDGERLHGCGNPLH